MVEKTTKTIETTKTLKTTTTARLQELFLNQYKQELQKELKLANVHEVPELERIVINVGLGRAKDDKKHLEIATKTLRRITGQQPVATVAKKSIASFKLREGNKIGLKVTLRGSQMYEFMDRFINIVLPRLRDFHGVSDKTFDRQGNYSIGLPDQTVFPEIDFEDSQVIHGLQANFVIKTKETAHSKALLLKFGMPFVKTKAKEDEKETK